jgi:hypothetical protein
MMNVYHLYNSNDGCSVFVETDMESEIFSKELHSFLSNDFQSNYLLTEEMFAERMKDKGFNVRVLKAKETFNWWKDEKPEDIINTETQFVIMTYDYDGKLMRVEEEIYTDKEKAEKARSRFEFVYKDAFYVREYNHQK